MNYAAYLRVYEPVSAFHEPDRSRWAAYAASGTRPRRRDALAAEQLAALRRLISDDWRADDWRAGEHAYVRFADGLVYICPWQIDLRGTRPPHPPVQERAGRPADDARWYIQTSGWTVPLAWFFPFAGPERWIALGRGTAYSQGGHGAVDLRATAYATRMLVYVATMTHARRRVARGLVTLRALGRELREREAGAAGRDLAVMEALTAMDELAGLGRWLERFHPHSLVELDYGGLVHLLSDGALCRDESAAEVGAVVAGMSRGHFELAHAMYRRVRARWLMFREFEQVN
jgi:hypothetical protein